MDIIDYYQALPDSVLESMRTLYTNIQFSGIDNPINVLGVTSATPQEGKTSTVCLLGITIAEANRRVLLVDLDLHRPQLASYFGQRKKIGLSNFIANRSLPLQHAVAETPIPRLFYMDVGTSVPNPVELINSKRFMEFIKKARENYDHVILDTPPLQMFVDAALISAHTDGMLLVVKARKTPSDHVKQSLAQLDKAKARVLGVALNQVDVADTAYYSYGGYGYSKGKKEKKLTFLKR